MKDLDEAEQFAIRVLSSVLCDVVIDHRDPGGGKLQLHDLDVTPRDEETIAVEVTTATVKLVRHKRAWWLKKKFTNPLPAPDLGFTWHVFPEARVDLRRLEGELGPALAALENEWATIGEEAKSSFFGPTDDAWSPAVQKLWRDLAIGYGVPRASDGESQIYVVSPSDDRAWSEARCGAFVVEALEAEAADSGNRKKLRDSGARERHLFVYVDPLTYPAWRDVDSGVLPLAAPALPPEITTAWVGTVDRHGQDVAWRFRPPGPWQVALS